MASDHPVQLTIDYPDRNLDRISSAFRFFTLIPIAIVFGAVAGGGYAWSHDASGRSSTQTGAAGVGLLILPPLLMIVFQQKYPRWWFDWNFNLMGFANRVTAYAALLTDTYPATDEEQSVHLELPYPDVKTDLNRWLPLVKWLLALPHYIVLLFLVLGAWVCVVIAWFAILFTGRYPRVLFDYVVGVMRWGNRVIAYVAALTTDEYPPFRLSA
jgi:cobalamin synthase